jgi:hypothetical protein
MRDLISSMQSLGSPRIPRHIFVPCNTSSPIRNHHFTAKRSPISQAPSSQGLLPQTFTSAAISCQISKPKPKISFNISAWVQKIKRGRHVRNIAVHKSDKAMRGLNLERGLLQSIMCCASNKRSLSAGIGIRSTYGECGTVVCSGMGRRDGGAEDSVFTQIFQVLLPGPRWATAAQSIESSAAFVKSAESVGVVLRGISGQCW